MLFSYSTPPPLAHLAFLKVNIMLETEDLVQSSERLSASLKTHSEKVAQTAFDSGSGWKGCAHLVSQTRGLPGNLSDPSGLAQPGSGKAGARLGGPGMPLQFTTPTQSCSLEARRAARRCEGPD